MTKYNFIAGVLIGVGLTFLGFYGDGSKPDLMEKRMAMEVSHG